MPELPEVETVAADLAQRLTGRYIKQMQIWCARLRIPVDAALPGLITRRKVLKVSRRAKYILVSFTHGQLGIHLGMSGTVRSDLPNSNPRKHDHVEWLLADAILRYNDPRRFGCIFWVDRHTKHPLLERAGIEPLSRQFTGLWFFALTRHKKVAIKTLLMDSSKIAGIGNIYASETLFHARVRPQRSAHTITRKQAGSIVACARQVLRKAIAAGGSSLRDYRYAEGKPGYFQLQHCVYGRAGLPCVSCKRSIERIVTAQRASFFCPRCQS